MADGLETGAHGGWRGAPEGANERVKVKGTNAEMVNGERSDP